MISTCRMQSADQANRIRSQGIIIGLFLEPGPGAKTPVVSFTIEVNPQLAKCPLIFNGRLADHGLTSLVKEATGHQYPECW